MAVMLPQALVIPLATLRRERVLSNAGEVTVRPGQRVEPMDVIARVSKPRGYRTVNLARLLGIRPDAVPGIMMVAPGDPITKGTVIAKKKSGFGFGGGGSVVKSPVDGVMASLKDGRAVIEIAPEIIEMRALVRGTVISAMAGYGIVIETAGALIQGAWGSGKEAHGVLKVATEPQQPLSSNEIDVSCRGTILVGGGTLEESGIKQAVQQVVRALVVGSVRAELAPALFSLPFPVVITEGFGMAPMADAVYRLLKDYEGRECAVDGRTPGTADGGRPDIIIPLPVNTPPESLSTRGSAVVVGSHVRALRAPYFGAIGEVKTLQDRARPLPTGSYAPGADVELEGHGLVFVPYANLEMIG